MIDFPFCFLAVRLVGPDRIGEVEHAIVDGFWHLVGVLLPSMKPENQGVLAAERHAEDRETKEAELSTHKGNGNASKQRSHRPSSNMFADIISQAYGPSYCSLMASTSP